MSDSTMRVEAVSEDTAMIRFGDTISEALIPQIVALEKRIEQRLGPLVIDLVPSYTTLLVHYDLNRADFRHVLRELRHLVADLEAHPEDAPAGRQVEIPVWYDPTVGYDLEALAERHELSVDEVIGIHSGKSYQVFAIGFNPGFGFLGRVDDRIATPRHKSPREAIDPGSVGIADAQTAIYPRLSPGGWQIIGRSPQLMFDPEQDPAHASLLQVGDTVTFRPIDRDTFISLGGQL
ncbi:5-oxoprolinase subunit PxpB [Natronospirillum operosum]|uniref:5-oxoprolinase subunit PxpB n=1 Tax=Natronospirillum operosum TaxID=2759953 RepID=A0A4Z0WD55_9GAMM|nr:5-oxoprolinase subunit PxpB [Natronospirillum operosum]TGG94033.1 5-oxoprolinase subunit PxpB [Natronospirillum operosum]